MSRQYSKKHTGAVVKHIIWRSDSNSDGAWFVHAAVLIIAKSTDLVSSETHMDEMEHPGIPGKNNKSALSSWEWCWPEFIYAVPKKMTTPFIYEDDWKPRKYRRSLRSETVKNWISFFDYQTLVAKLDKNIIPDAEYYNIMDYGIFWIWIWLSFDLTGRTAIVTGRRKWNW